MRLLVQRVNEAQVKVNDETIGAIDRGFLVFIGVCDSDDEAVADKMLNKLLALRIFEDENGKTNLSICDESVSGSLLLVSQFTLYADCSHGNRPSFVKAGAPDHANSLYEYMIIQAKERLGSERVATGSFGADMKVSLLNDGPFTIWMDSDEIIKK